MFLHRLFVVYYSLFSLYLLKLPGGVVALFAFRCKLLKTDFVNNHDLWGKEDLAVIKRIFFFSYTIRGKLPCYKLIQLLHHLATVKCSLMSDQWLWILRKPLPLETAQSFCPLFTSEMMYVGFPINSSLLSFWKQEFAFWTMI